MADFTVLRQEMFEMHPGQRGYREIVGTAAFPTTALTGTLIVVPLLSVFDVSLTMGGAPAAASKQFNFPTSATISASAAFLMEIPVAGTISAAALVVDTTVATDAANIWTIGIINTTATLTPVDIAVAANSNNSTGGSAFTADTVRSLTLNTSAAQLAVAAGDVLELTLTKASSAANLVEPIVYVQLSSGAGDEQLYCTRGSDGLIAVTSGKITIGRVATSPTSALKFGYKVRGR